MHLSNTALRTGQVRLVASCAWLALVAACAQQRVSAPCFALEEVRRLGKLEGTPAANSKSAASNPAVLGNIRGIVPGPNGELFVLDRSSYRVIVFGSDGSVVRVIEGGAGQGPGEFILPMHLASTGRGVSVVDYELRRITEFDWSGRLVRTTALRTRSPWQHVVRGDTAWVTFSSPERTTESAFQIVTLENGNVTEGLSLTEPDQPFGVLPGVAFDPSGELLVNTARPGVWMAHTNGRWIRRGTPRFPNDAPPVTEQTAPRQWRVTPARHSAAGLAVLGDSLVLQGTFSLFRPFDWNDPPARDEHADSLGVYRVDGQHLATVALPVGTSSAYLSTEPRSGRIFMPGTDPFPQVVEFRLAQCASRRS